MTDPMEEMHGFISEEDLNDENIVFELSMPSTNWGQLVLDLPDAWQHTKGEGIVVGVIDTGGPDHIDINDNILQRLDITGDGPEDRAGHGCIIGEDCIYTSSDHLIDIKTFYDTAPYTQLLIDLDKDCEIKTIEGDIYTIGYLNSKFIKSRIKAVHKLLYTGFVYKIKTKNREVTLTPWHPIYVKRDNKITKITADNLEINDKIICGNMDRVRNVRFQSIISIEILDFSGILYDLTVEKCTNYLSNGILVSNTHISGIIAALENDIGITGVAPLSKLITIKVLDNKGMGSFSNMAKGLELCKNLNVDIINMSLGVPAEPPQEIHNLIKQLTDQGKIIIAAAGNSPNEPVNYPAAYDEVIAVAPIDENRNIADFASVGPKIAVASPGVDIYSLYLNNGYKTLSGSSQAAPFFSGIVALILSYDRESKELSIRSYQDILKILDILCNEKTNDHLSGRLKGCNFGIPNFSNYMPWKEKK